MTDWMPQFGRLYSPHVEPDTATLLTDDGDIIRRVYDGEEIRDVFNREERENAYALVHGVKHWPNDLQVKP